MGIYIICLVLAAVIFILELIHYTERKDLYNRAFGNTPKKNAKPPNTPKSAHEKALEDWRKPY